ncbi:acyltransferase family protein [Pseudomonas sp. S2_H01]
MKYRSDIDGLRAVAVLSIVLFHLNAKILPGGFVGVDVFFVISGYLISKIIYSEVEEKIFSLSTFYVRRAKRILPALLSMLCLTSAVAYSQLYPSELVSYAKSVISSALFLSNIYFYETLNYFSPAADEIPLLHLWSLGIEEQFYIFFPLIIIAVCRFWKSAIPWVVASLLLLSVCFSEVILHISPSASFYLLPLRAFELLIGSLIAIQSGQIAKYSFNSNIVALTGAVALLYSICFYNSSMRFPGLAAVLPSLGAALLIVGGARRNFASHLLESKFMVFFGKISYSLYLVHWPLIVFAKRSLPHLNDYAFVGIVFVISTVMAYCNYRWIEQPFRGNRVASQPRTVLGASALSLTILILAASVVVMENGFPKAIDQRSAKALEILQYNPATDYLSGTCFLDPDQIPSLAERSKCLPPRSKATAILWGDSHAIHLYGGLKETFAERGITLGALTGSVCPPILGVDIPARPYCREANDQNFQLISQTRPDILIMTARWYPDPTMVTAFSKTLDKVSALGIKIVVLGESPTYKQSVPIIVARLIKEGKNSFYATSDLDEEVIERAEKAVSEIAEGKPHIRYISVFNTICPNKSCPLTTADEVPMYYDIAHLTPNGSRFFAKELTPLILQ